MSRKPTSDNGAPDAPRRKGRSAFDRLIAFARSAELFHWSGEVFLTLPVKDRRETHRLRSRAARGWLQQRYYAERGGCAKAQTLEEALLFTEHEALENAEERRPALRVGEHEGRIYLDLCDDQWRVVEIRKDGWDVLPGGKSPVPFVRTKSMRALPVPEKGGSIGDLRAYLNVSDKQFPLITAFCAAAFRPTGPYPALALMGESGTAKTTVSKVLRSLIDPSTAAVRRPPRDERDLFIGAKNSWVLCLDNLSDLPQDISDGLAAIATGGGFQTRRLHTDDDETTIEVARPIILNGITEVAVRADIADRALAIYLQPIPKDKRRLESEFWQEFYKERPFILGALCDAVSCGLRRIGTVRLPTLPRMADFAAWGEAAGPELGLPDGKTFSDLFESNIAGQVEAAIENDVVGDLVRDLARDIDAGEIPSPEPAPAGVWLGRPKALLDLLTGRAGEHATKKGFPTTPSVLSGRLRRITNKLRAIDVEVDWHENNHRPLFQIAVKKAP